jgi:integrase
MASIDQRPGGAYRIRWRNNGTPDGVTADSLSRAEAVKAFVEDRRGRVTRTEVYRALYPGAEESDDTPALAAWVEMWTGQMDDVQPDTLHGYLQQIGKWITPRLGQYRLDAITQDVVEDWVGWLKTRTSRRGTSLSSTSIRHAHALLHQLLGAAVPRHMPSNPAARPRGSRKGTRGLPKHVRYEATFLEPAEAEMILACASPHIRDMVKVALGTGLRLGELLVLRVQDVDLRASVPVLTVRRALKNDRTVGLPKSVRSRRTVSLSPKTVEVLRPRVEGKGRMSLVFPSPTGLVWTKQNLEQRHWVPAVAQARRCAEHPPPAPAKAKTGPARKLRRDEVSTCDCPGRLDKEPRFHDLRHSHASWLIGLGEDIFVVSRRLGHDSITTTVDLYGHLRPAGDGRKLQALDDLAA